MKRTDECAGGDMKKIGLVLAVVFLVVGLTGCGKKSGSSSEENLNPANAIEKYGGVMGKSYKRAKSLDVLLSLRHSIRSFQFTEGRFPNSLQELVDKNYIKELPHPPEGMQFTYDPKAGTVGLK
jgi:hypothetical protein